MAEVASATLSSSADDLNGAAANPMAELNTATPLNRSGNVSQESAETQTAEEFQKVIVDETDSSLKPSAPELEEEMAASTSADDTHNSSEVCLTDSAMVCCALLLGLPVCRLLALKIKLTF